MSYRSAVALLFVVGCTAEPGDLLQSPNNQPSPTPPKKTCRVQSTRATLLSNFTAHNEPTATGLRVDEGTLVHNARFDDTGRRGISKVDLATGNVLAQLRSNRGNLWVLDADDGVLLYALEISRDDYEVVYRFADGREEVVETDSERPVVQPPFDYLGARTRAVDSTGAVFLHGSRLHSFEATHLTRVIRDHPTHVMTREGTRIVFADPAMGRPSGLFVVDGPDDSPRSIASHGEGIAHVELEGDRLYYVAGRALYLYDLSTSVSRVLYEGPCGPPSADGDRMIVACGDPGVPPDGVSPPGDRLLYFNGQDIIELPVGDGYHHSPRLSGKAIAWIRYPSPDALCQGGPGNVGVVRHYVPDDRVGPLDVAAIGAPCLCCGAIHPPVELDFEGEFIAWSYPANQQAPYGQIGAARITTVEVCN